MSAMQMTWTELSDKSGTTMTAHTGSYEQLIERVRNVGTSPDKEHCPWLKLASFSDKRTAKGSLRHNDNVAAFDGIEGDYDGEKVTMEQAGTMLERHDIRALLYPSLSAPLEY